MKFSYENKILKPPEIVFPWIAEPENAMKWQKKVKGGEILEQKSGMVGTTYKEIIEEDGDTLEMFGTITQYIEDQLIGFHLESKIHTVDVRYALEEIEAGSKISIEAIIQWKFPMNIITLFIGNKIEAGFVQELESEVLELKRICENV